jgi:hypothetical protein
MKCKKTFQNLRQQKWSENIGSFKSWYLNYIFQQKYHETSKLFFLCQSINVTYHNSTFYFTWKNNKLVSCLRELSKKKNSRENRSKFIYFFSVEFHEVSHFEIISIDWDTKAINKFPHKTSNNCATDETQNILTLLK